MSPRWSLRASSPQLPKLGMELKINTMDGELIEVGSSEAARKVILLHGLTGTGSVIKRLPNISEGVWGMTILSSFRQHPLSGSNNLMENLFTPGSTLKTVIFEKK